MGVRRSTPPCKPNATAHEPSRKTLAAFACERSTGAATLLRLRQTLGLGLGIARTTSAPSRAARPWSLPAPVSVGLRAMLHGEIKPIAHRCARNQVASFSLWVRATGGQAHGHRHRRALLSRGRRHGLASLGAATGFLVNPFGSICRVSGGPS